MKHYKITYVFYLDSNCTKKNIGLFGNNDINFAAADCGLSFTENNLVPIPRFFKDDLIKKIISDAQIDYIYTDEENVDIFKDIDRYYIKKGTSMCYTLNISIFVFILIKGIYNILKNSSKDNIKKEFSIKLNKLFIMQNKKLNEYKIDINENTEINRIFSKYYLKYVMISLENFYIDV